MSSRQHRLEMSSTNKNKTPSDRKIVRNKWANKWRQFCEIKRRQHHKEFEEMMIKVDDIINNKNYISDDSERKRERKRK